MKRHTRGILRAGICLLAVNLVLGRPVDLLPRPEPPARTLTAAQAWRLQPPAGERFDASGLVRLPDGTLLTVNDKRAGLYRIELPATGDVARLVPLPGLFTAEALEAAAGARAKLHDLEGLAYDGDGHVYACDESSRNIFRQSLEGGPAERLRIDWTPARRWFGRDGNASWEGLAVAGDRLYVANERAVGRIFVVALTNRAILKSFAVAPPGRPAADVHYSDLSWFDGRLWVLCRESQCVLEVDPESEKVLAAHDYRAVEQDPGLAYFNPLPYGFVEGLALDGENFWFVVDNNGTPRLADRSDTRPSLWRCTRPKPPAGPPPRAVPAPAD